MKPTIRNRRKADLVRDLDSHADAMIELRGVVKRFSNAAGVFTVLKGIDLTINRGEFVSIVGRWISRSAIPRDFQRRVSRRNWTGFDHCRVGWRTVWSKTRLGRRHSIEPVH